MKKLLVMAAMAMTGWALQAASVQWAVSGVYQPETTTAASGYAAYLFTTAVAQADVIAAIGNGTFGATYASQALASGETNTSGAILKSGIGSYTGTTESPTVVSLYAVVFDVGADSLASAENYAISATPVDVTFTSSTGTKTALFKDFSTNNGWQAVPEPTSGLLLLVGGALLALKRKRA